MEPNRRLSLKRLKGKQRMAPRKPIFVGQASIRGRGGSGEGVIVGTAKIEKLSSGALIAHVDASGMSAEFLRRGFSLEPVTESEKETDA